MPPIPPEGMQVPTVLSIAGSDPSGGAGIQADLKTFAVIGVYGGAVITSLTIQNTMGVSGITVLAPAVVKDQITAVLTDLTVSHVKIGMVGSEAAAIAIVEALADFDGEVIYDPVIKSTSGNALIQADGPAALAEPLLSRATILTPNIPEFSLLLGETDAAPGNLTETEQAAILFDRFPRLRAMILTGGHGPERTDSVTDSLFLRQDGQAQPSRLARSHPRIRTANSHGTGCTFASAFAAFHQQTGDYATAFARTTSFMAGLISASAPYRIGHGNGPLLHHLRPEPENG